MNRSLGVERNYYLGPYRTLRITDYINEIPINKLDLNPEAVALIRNLQLLGVEKAYHTYHESSEVLSQFETDEERIEKIVDMETNTVDKLRELLEEFLNTEE